MDNPTHGIITQNYSAELLEWWLRSGIWKLSRYITWYVWWRPPSRLWCTGVWVIVCLEARKRIFLYKLPEKWTFWVFFLLYRYRFVYGTSVYGRVWTSESSKWFFSYISNQKNGTFWVFHYLNMGWFIVAWCTGVWTCMDLWKLERVFFLYR